MPTFILRICILHTCTALSCTCVCHFFYREDLQDKSGFTVDNWVFLSTHCLFAGYTWKWHGRIWFNYIDMQYGWAHCSWSYAQDHNVVAIDMMAIRWTQGFVWNGPLLECLKGSPDPLPPILLKPKSFKINILYKRGIPILIIIESFLVEWKT